MLLTARKSNQYPSLMNEFLNDGWDEFWRPVNHTHTVAPAVNIRESENEYAIELAVPGANKENFNIKIDNGLLTVSSGKNEAQKEASEKYSRCEFNYAVFSKTFELPKGKVREDKIEAKYENGVLELVIPKSEEAKVKPSREIKIA